MTDTPAEREPGGPLGQLYRRKMVQWAIAYAAAAWTLLQVIEYLAETYDWPPAIRQIAVPVLSLGSLFVLVLAWYHGDKGEQKVSRQELALLASLLLTAGGVMWWFVAHLDANAWLPASAGVAIPHAVPTDTPSVAVLPFVNMSSDPEQEYFADGLSEEILNSLARIPGLFVPARTSSFQFKGKAGDVAKFAALLGVAHVLEGSVRKSGGRVRITAQLISAADGYHVWSQTYDRELAEIFDTQEEIASAIAEALRVQLTPQQKKEIAQKPPTSNQQAYDAYLLGRFELNKRSSGTRKSIAHFEKAIALDPSFAAAYADLAIALLLDGRPECDTIPQPACLQRILAEAGPLVEKALALAPGRPEPLSAAGKLAWAEGRRDAALEYLDRSLALRPNDGEVLTWRRWILSESTRYDEALRASYESVQRDPLSWLALYNHAQQLLLWGRRGDMLATVDRLRTIDRSRGLEAAGWIAAWDGDRAEALRLYLEADELAQLESGERSLKGETAILFASLGLKEEVFALRPRWSALLMTASCREALPEVRAAVLSGEASAHRLGMVLYCAGEYEEALERLTSFWDVWLPARGNISAGSLLVAADCARRIGRDADAKSFRDRAAASILAKSKAGMLIQGQLALESALLQAFDGRDAEAAESLAVAIRSWDLVNDAETHPLLVGIARRPEFQAVIAKEREKIVRQRAEVLQMLCGPNPAFKTYKPAAETCASRKNPG